jgi:hypothetical protein
VHWKSVLDILEEKADLKEWYFQHDERVGWRQTRHEELKNTGYYDQRNSGAAAIAVVIATKR